MSAVVEQFLRDVQAQYDAGAGTITLGSNIDAAVGALLGYAQTASIALTGASVSSTATQVYVRGDGPMPNLGGPQVVELVGTDNAGALGLVLTARPMNPIDLRELFPGLKGTATAQPDATIVAEASLFYRMDYRQPQWLISNVAPPAGTLYPSLGLNLKADVPIAALFPRVVTLTGLSVVTFKGPVLFAAGQPTELYLDAEFPGVQLGIGSTMRLGDFHLIVRTTYYTDAPEQDNTGSLFNGLFEISADLRIRVGVDTRLVPPDNRASSIWAFYADIEPPGITLAAGVNALAGFVGIGGFTLPPSLPLIGTVGLTDLVIGINPHDFTDVEFVFLEVGTREKWQPMPWVSVEDVRLQWQILRPFDGTGRDQSGGVGGTLAFGTQSPARIDLSALIPDYVVTADLRAGDQISAVAVVSNFFPDAGGLAQDLVIDTLSIVANIDNNVYELSGSLKPVPQLSLDLVITTLVLERVSVNVTYAPDQLYGTILANLDLFDAGWQVSASYLKPAAGASGNWSFLVQLEPGETVELTTLVRRFLDFAPAYLPELTVEGLYFFYDLATRTYRFKGTIKGRWPLPLVPGSPPLEAKAAVDVQSFLQTGGLVAYKGSIDGALSISNFKLGVGYAFDPTSTTFNFVAAYKSLALYGSLIRTRKKDGTEHSILRLNFGDLSLGDIITYLVNLANPNLEFRLESPWDILNSLNLKNLTLVVDFNENTVGIEYRLDVDLVFVAIDAVSLTLLTKSDGKRTVRIGISGRFLDQRFGGPNADELGWDLIDDPPPAVPGRGNRLFELKFLGFGQHVAVANASEMETVEQVITALKSAMKPVADPNANPLSQIDTLVFNKDSHILFGVEFIVLDGVAISAVFNDPNLYGILIKLSGEVAGSLAGLKFELLYKRITETLGVFKVVLQVPDVFRQLDFGTVSITLPIIKVDIYTNGNFRIDLGFPTDDTFSESFGVQVFPFIGKGGFYFGYLVGAASKTVPRVTNGEFAPVIELGLALAIGVGKEIRKGPLSAGLSLTVQAILEGTLAWFHPNNASLPQTTYFRVAGSAAIVGKLFGAVDFKVVKVSFAVTAKASVTLVVECYMPIKVALAIEVSVQASIKILFVRVNFSFDLTLDLSFEIGAASPTPWVLDPAASAAPRLGAPSRQTLGRSRSAARAIPTTTRLRTVAPRNRALAVRRHGDERMRRTIIRQRDRAVGRSAALAAVPADRLAALLPRATFDWAARAVFPGLQTVPILVLPALSVADNATLLPEDRTSGPTSNQLPLTFVVENGISPSAETLDDLRRMSAEAAHATSDPGTLPFNLLVEGLLAWSIASFLDESGGDPLAGDITRHELELMVEALNKTEIEGDGFSSAQLAAFFRANYLFRLGAFVGDPSAVNASGATFLPVSPILSLAVPSRQTIDFSRFRMVGDHYEDTVAAYFAAMAVDYGADTATDPADLAILSPPGAVESVAAMVQRDYFTMVARAGAQKALDLMQTLPVAVTADDSLAAVVARYPRGTAQHRIHAGETLASLEATYETTEAQLQSLNPGVDFDGPLVPGTVILVPEGPTVESVVAANATRTELLASGAVVPITGAAVQVGAGDTLALLATRFGVSLSSIVDLNGASRLLLAPGQLFALPSFDYRSVAGDSLNLVAAFLMVRNGRIPASADQAWYALPQLDWYQQTIADLNASGEAPVDFDRQIPAGTAIKVPPALDRSAPADALTYASRAQDTLERIAGYFLLTQAPTLGLIAFRNSLQMGITPPPDPNAALPVGTLVTVPAWNHAIQTNDSLDAIALLLGVPMSVLITSASFGQSNVLADLAAVRLPTLDYTIPDADQTFNSLADIFNLTLDALADSLRVTEGYFTRSLLMVPNLYQLPVASLRSAVVEGANEIAATSSRYMMHGLRLPAVPPEPDDPVDTSVLYGLYEIVGQQVPIDLLTLPARLTLGRAGPAAPLTPSYVVGAYETWDSLVAAYPGFAADNPGLRPGNIRPGLSVTISTDAAIVFNQTKLLADGDTWDSIVAAYAAFPSYNPGLAPTDIKPGLLVFIGQPDELVLDIDQAFVDGQGASSELDLHWLAPLGALPLAAGNTARYTLPDATGWQTPTRPDYGGIAVPSTGPGMPTLWLFPSAVLQQIADGTTGSFAYELQQGQLDDRGQMVSVPVAEYSWATLITLSIRQVPSEPPGLATVSAPAPSPRQPAPTGSMPNTYQIMTGPEDAQQRLHDLWSTLRAEPGEAAAQVRLLYAASPQSDNPDGLVSLDEDETLTCVIKTNLSTLSSSGQALSRTARQLRTRAFATDTGPGYVAPVTEAGDFLQLLWEAGVVGSGGYFLNYVAAGEGLPARLFDDRGRAQLRLLVVLPSQSRATDPVRAFRPFNNVAVIGDTIGAGANVYVQRTDGSDRVISAVVPPGVVAFAGSRTQPSVEAPAAGAYAWRTQVLYSLIGYRVAASGGFAQSHQALPIGPAVPPEGVAAFRASASPVLQPWYYQQSVPAAELAPARLAATPFLPPPTQDPYRGIVPEARLTIGFSAHDVYGNQLAPIPVLPAVPLDVGYTDPLIPLASWPGTTASYDVFHGTATGFTIALTFQAGSTVPGNGSDPAELPATVSAQTLKYSQVYYQIAQSDLSLSLAVSLLKNPARPDGAFPMDVTRLSQYVQSVYVFLGAAARVAPLAATVSGTASSFASLTAQYPVTVPALGAANAKALLRHLFATVAIPAYAPFPQDGTLSQVARTAGSTAGALATLNPEVLLTAGIVVATPSRSFTAGGAATLGGIAATHVTTVDDLAITNAANRDILAAGMPVTVEDTVLVIESGNSFDDLVTRFAAAGVTTNPQTIATANAEISGLIVADSALTTVAWVARPVETFATIIAANPSWNLAQLGTTAAEVHNLVRPGLALALGTSTSVMPTAFDTFDGYTTVYGLTLDQLAAANAQTALNDGARVSIPGIATIDATDAAPVFVPFSLPTGATWTGVATALGCVDEAAQVLLMTRNGNTPDLLLPGQTVGIGSTSMTTAAGSTFASVLAALNGEGTAYGYADLITAIATQAGLLRPGGTLGTAMPPLPPDATLRQAAAGFGLLPEALAVANAALPGLIAAGLTLTIERQSLETVANDTFATIALRFTATERGRPVGIESVARAAADLAGFLVAEAQVLLPPAAVAIDVPFYAAPPAEPPYVGTVIELTASLTLARPTDCIAPEFEGAPAVGRFVNAVSPRLEGDQQVLLLTPFALRFEQAFPGLKLAVGARQAEDEGGKPSHLFCVNFTSTGISKVDITAGQPAVYAIKPIATRVISLEDLSIRPLLTDGSLGPAEGRAFSDIDPGTWAEQALAAIDLLLAPELVVPTLQLAPASFTSIVETKGMLATTVSNGLEAVLDGTDVSGIASARERLRQALLTDLSGGFAVAAVLQYAADVASAGDSAANLSGKPVPRVDAATGDWGFELTLTAALTFEGLQQFYGIGMSNLIGQIADLTPLLAMGGVFAYPGYPDVTVTDPATTLSDVAHQFGLTDPTPLARYNRLVPGYFVPGLVLTVRVSVPAFDVSIGKTAVSTGTHFVDFLMTVPNERRYRALLADLVYQINEFEYDIEEVPSGQGFQSSKWLSFVVPITPTDRPAAIRRLSLGQADVPLALRAYPDLPVMLDQSGVPGIVPPRTPFPDNLLKARTWSYDFVFEQLSAAQDQSFLTVLFNQDPDTAALRTEAGLRALCQALAQFQTIYPALKTMLLGLLDPAAVAARPIEIANALATFATVTRDIATAWAAYWPPDRATAAMRSGPEATRFDVQIVPVTDPGSEGPVMRSLVLTAIDGAGYDVSVYPEIAFQNPVTGHMVPLIKTPTASRSEVAYLFPQGAVPAFQAIRYAYSFDGLNAVADQAARAQLLVRRNADLVPWASTAADFVYETPPVAFSAPAYPALVRNQVIDVRVSPTETLAEAVDAIFGTLLSGGSGEYVLRVVARYGYTLAVPTGTPSDDPLSDADLISEVPVIFFPSFTYTDAFKATLVAALDLWFSHHAPATDRGSFVFELTVFSTLDAAQLQPVLLLRRVLFPLS